MANPIINFVTKVCVQDAIYWEVDEDDGFGRFNYKPPRDIKCRADEKIKVVIGSTGEEVVSNAELLVLEDLKVGSFILVGSTVSSLDSETRFNPEDVDGATRILSRDKTPLFKSATEFVRQVYI